MCALSCGLSTDDVIRMVSDPESPRATKQNLQYWKKMALDRGILVEVYEDDYTGAKTYGAGPNFHIVHKLPGTWQYARTRVLKCRTHCAGGNAIHAPVEIANTDCDLEITDIHGDIKTFQVNPHTAKRRLEATFSIHVPFEFVGYHGAYATVQYIRFHRLRKPTDHLYISPPEAHLTLEHLSDPEANLLVDIGQLNDRYSIAGHESDPFTWSVEYVLGVLEDNGWIIGDWENTQGIHYGFDRRVVKFYCPALWERVPYIGSPGHHKPENLWTDRSHGTRELETDNLDLAVEIMTLLELRRREIDGDTKCRCSPYKILDSGDGRFA
ncbi:MAG: hypothetical protein AB9860_01605 [Methanomassiliicoccales archaeon]